MAQKLRRPTTYAKHPVVNLGDVREVVFNNVRKQFPDVEPNYLKDIILAVTCSGRRSVKIVTDMVVTDLTENDNYPRLEPWMISIVQEHNKENKNTENVRDYFLDYGDYVSARYKTQCIWLLKNDFRYLSVRQIIKVAQKFNYHYAPSKYCLTLLWRPILATHLAFNETPNQNKQKMHVKISDDITVTVGNETITMKVVVLSRPRVYEPFRWRLLPPLQLEKDFFEIKIKSIEEEGDFKIAMDVNENEYKDSHQLIECGCCYGSFMFEMLIQCYEGHLFCSECVQGYVKEAIFGSGGARLECLAEDCEETFPRMQLHKAVSQEILIQYEKRVKQESINLAGIENLVNCPYCEFACILDPSEKVFHCYNPSCLRETCRLCQEDWATHFGLPCDKVEKKDEMKVRVTFEERMTEAKIRICHKCKSRFTKLDGCNKMYCRCGSTMCYLCRMPNVSYQHFCNHARKKKSPCTHCNACILWTDAKEDEEIALDAIKKEAENLIGLNARTSNVNESDTLVKTK